MEKTLNGIPIIQDELEAMKELLHGKTITRYEFGDSMFPILLSGEYAILTPISNLNEIKIGDAVFCDVMGYLMTHKVIDKENNNFLIGPTNPSNVAYGWTNKIYAIATSWKDNKDYKKRIIVQEPINY